MRRDPFRRQPHTRAQGREAEERAVEWLCQNGYRILERNVEFKSGEIDVVASHRGTLCFIEVKARAGDGYGPAIEAVTHKKKRRIARAASLYLVRHPTDAPCRFDVLAMDLVEDGWRYTLVKDAFTA